MIRKRHLGALLCATFGCSNQAAAPPHTASDAPAEAAEGSSLQSVLEAQEDGDKARYQYRHPKETLEFFGVGPGMVVVDTLPGDVWYTGLLLDYLGPAGKVVPADYSAEMWTHFGDFTPDPAEKATWPADMVAKLESKRDAGDAQVAAFQYGSRPAGLEGEVDVVLVVRALHHFMRLEEQGGFLTQALSDMHELLKPGGVVGVVQHRAPESNSDEWAGGDKGYVKQSAVIAAFEAAGFELEDKSEVNANPNDQPTEQDMVWRLPPSLATSRENAELAARMKAIGETDRMTLKFRKPR